MVHTWFSPKWVIRTSGPPANLSGQIRAAAAQVDPRLPIAHFRTVDELRNARTGGQRYLAALFSILAAVGLYGLISQSVAQRRHEIGVRLGLGATARQSIAGVIRPGILLSVTGIVVGLGMSLVAVRLLRAMLWGVRATDPGTFAAASAILLLVAALASVAPALRILRMDPAETLRSE
jgi:predicted lysophospholipase L1 biosynthesis ABC-type transport system permease subunit